MTKGQFALIVVIGLLVAGAVALLIAAPCLGYTSIVEMFRAWVGSNPVTPAPEEIPEATSILFNLIRI